jgi:hypothetical protein
MERPMERSEIIATMGTLKLYGMKAAFDQIITTAVKRQHEPQRVIGDFLAAEVAEKQARSIKYQIAIAKLPLAKDIDDFSFADTPVNETLVRDLAAGNFLAQQRNVVLATTSSDGQCWLCEPLGVSGVLCGQEFLLCQREGVKEGLHRGLAIAPAALVRSVVIVCADPGIEIGLEILDGPVDLLAERHAIELIEHGAMEALADAVGLRAFGFGPGVIDVLDSQVEFVFVPFRVAAVFGSPVGQHPAEPDVVLIEERHHTVVQQVGGGDRRLAVVELGKRHLGVGIDEALLIDPPDALQGADVECVLRPAVARALALELAMGLLILLGLDPLRGSSQGNELGFGEHHAVLCHRGFQRLQPLLHGFQVMALPDTAHAGR